MSLVNDMLRDLDARQRGELSAVAAIQGSSKPKRSRQRLWVTVIICLVLCLLAAYLAVRSFAPWILQDINKQLVAPSTQPQTQAVSEPQALTPVRTEQQPVVETSGLESASDELVNNDATSTPAGASTQPAANTVTKINWTGLADGHGYLSIWLTSTRPFTVHENSAQAFEWDIAQTQLAIALPKTLSDHVSRFTQLPSDTGTRFRIETRVPMRFKPSLRQNPARMVVDVSMVRAAPSGAVATQALVANESSPEASRVETEPSAARVAEPESTTESTPAAASPAAVSSPEVSVENNTPDTNEVSGTWRKAMNTKPTDSSTVREARRLLAKNDINAAVQRLEKFVAQYQKSDQSRYLLAQLYLSTENYSSAQRVIDGAPASLSWALLNARAQLQQGNGDLALALLQQYPEAQAREDYVDLLASAYQLQGDHRQAVQSYLTVLALNPQQARAWINMGISLEHLQQQSRAIDAYQNAIRIPDIPPALRQYAAQQLQRLQ